MRCEPPMPAQFISTRATPCAASAFASAALTCSSSVTSAWRATPFTSAATFSAFSLLWSSTPIFAPLAAMARAVAAPRPEPPPVMTTATSFNCMVLILPWAFPETWLFLMASSDWNSLFATRQYSPADQRFHVPDILPAHLVGDGADAAGARHRMPSEKQVIAGADQTRIEQHRIDVAEFAGLDALRQQPPMK